MMTKQKLNLLLKFDFYFNINWNIYTKIEVLKFKTVSFCVGGRHNFSTKSIEVDITGSSQFFWIGKCAYCNRKKSIIVSDNTKQAQRLNNLFKNISKASDKAGRKLATIVEKIIPKRVWILNKECSADVKMDSQASLSTFSDLTSFLSNWIRILSWKNLVDINVK